MLARLAFFLVGSVTCWPDVVLCSRDESLVQIDYWTMKSRLRERKKAVRCIQTYSISFDVKSELS